MQKIINSCVCNLVCHAWLHHELIVSCKDALTVSILSWKETSQDWRWRRGWYIFICKFAVNAQPSRGNLKQVYDSLLVCMEFLLVWTLELVFHAILWDMVILRNNSSSGIAKPQTNYDKWYPFLLWSKMVPLRNSFVSL